MASDKIQQAVERFVNELRALLAAEAREALIAALNGEQPARQAAPARRGPGRPARKAEKGGRRVRRTAEDLEAVQQKILAALKKQPGANSEELQAALGLEKADIQRPLVLLREANKIKTEGQKRATRYFVKGRA